MMDTTSESASEGLCGSDMSAAGTSARDAACSTSKTFSNNACGGASGQISRRESRNAASPQQTSDGEQSLIIVTSSDGAWREYSGTTTSPSAMMARFIAIQSMPLAARS